MCQDRNIIRQEQFEKEIFQPDRRDMVRRLNKHIARISQRQQMAGLKTRYKIRRDVGIRARNQLKWNVLFLEGVL